MSGSCLPLVFFFLFLSSSSSSSSSSFYFFLFFLFACVFAKSMGSAKTPPNIRALACLVVHKKVNADDSLQLRLLLVPGEWEHVDHLFLHCFSAPSLWQITIIFSGNFVKKS